MEQKYDLSRFKIAQERDYKTALNEIRNGRKINHWMWYIFPQVKGLGFSETSKYYAIKNAEEAKAFLSDSYLGNNLIKICEELLNLNTNNATQIFGNPDDKKLKSSMTLFSCVSEENSIFKKVLLKFYGGRPDYRTLKLIEDSK